VVEVLDCDRTKDFLTKQGLSFSSKPLPADAGAATVIATIGDKVVKFAPEASGDIVKFDDKVLNDVLKGLGYPAKADPAQVNWPMALLILWIMMIYVTLVYGPIAAFLVELFPTRIRYTSMSLPYHIGNGWFGGMLPLLATALVAANGDIYYGLWYPIIVAAMTAVIGFLFLREKKIADLHADDQLAVRGA